MLELKHIDYYDFAWDERKRAEKEGLVYAELDETSLRKIETIEQIGQAQCRNINSSSIPEFGQVPYGLKITLDEFDKFMERHNYKKFGVYRLKGKTPVAIYERKTDGVKRLTMGDLAEFYVGTKFEYRVISWYSNLHDARMREEYKAERTEDGRFLWRLIKGPEEVSS